MNKRLEPTRERELILSGRSLFDLEGIRLELEKLFLRPHPAPVIILGNQKSGTTVISALLGRLTGLPAALDLEKEVRDPSFQDVIMKKKTLRSFVGRNKADFSQPLIKEPNLTLLYPGLRNFFPRIRLYRPGSREKHRASPRCARPLGRVRDPRFNLRSMLNRLKVPKGQGSKIAGRRPAGYFS